MLRNKNSHGNNREVTINRFYLFCIQNVDLNVISIFLLSRSVIKSSDYKRDGSS